MSQHVRSSQRAPRSCTECSRRKVRCSKTVPCSACVRRGESALCAREVVRVNGRITVAVDEDAEIHVADADQVAQLRNANSDLQARIERLEAVLWRQGQGQEQGQEQGQGRGGRGGRGGGGGGGGQGETSLAGPATALTPPSPACEIFLSDENILSAFQGLQLESPAKAPSPSHRRDKGQRTEYLFSILPTRASSEAIVRFSLQNLGWVHCALNAPAFLAQHEDFWRGLQAKDSQVLEDHGWIALYLSVISVGVYFFDESDGVELHFLHEGVFLWHGTPALSDAGNDFQAVSRAWYEAVLEELSHADFLGAPTVSTVQTIAILPLIHRNLGEVEREHNLLAVAINTAKALQMDLLGREGSPLPRQSTSHYWRDRSNRELGRRLWWTLVICDWMMMPIRPCMIEPGSFTSALSLETDTSHRDIILNSAAPPGFDLPYFPEPLGYHIFVARVASIVRPFRDRSIKFSMAGACTTLTSLNALAQALPPHLSIDKDPQFAAMTLIPWIEAQRSLAIMLLSVCRINICLLALLETLDAGEDPFDLRGCGRRAAITIVEHLRDQPVRYFNKMWGQRSCIFSAGVYLALDVICFRGTMDAAEIESQVADIHFALQRVQGMGGDADGAPEVLKRLLRVYQQLPVHQVVQRQTITGILISVADPIRDWTLEASVPCASAGTSSASLTPNSTLLQAPPHQFPTTDIVESVFDAEFDAALGGMAFDFLPNHLQLEGDWPSDAFTNTLSWQHMS